MWNLCVSKTICHIRIKIDMPNPSQEPSAPTKAPNQDLKDMDVICIFKYKIEPKFGTCVNQRQVTIFKSVSRCKTPVKILQYPRKPKIRTKGHRCSLHLQNQDRKTKFGIWVNQIPVTISKSISGCKIPVRNIQCPPKPQIRT